MGAKIGGEHSTIQNALFQSKDDSSKAEQEDGLKIKIKNGK